MNYLLSCLVALVILGAISGMSSSEQYNETVFISTAGGTVDAIGNQRYLDTCYATDPDIPVPGRIRLIRAHHLNDGDLVRVSGSLILPENEPKLQYVNMIVTSWNYIPNCP